jgi:hypothetical protein
MNDGIYAPVMVTTICRFEKFKRCIESLNNCTDADKTELFVGVDYPAKEEHWPGYRKICEYLPSIKGFKEVHVFKRSENWGQSKNGKDLQSRIREKYDRCIMTEDDCEFSPCFLQYMNQCLEKYREDRKVFSICGYSYLEWEKNNQDYPYNAFPIHGYCAWGTGIWFDKYDAYILSSFPAENIIKNPKIVRYMFSVKKHKLIHYLLFRYKGNAADIRRACFYSLNDKYSIYPKISKVRNNGFDGEASNCAEITSYAKQIIDTDVTFTLDDFEIGETRQLRRLHDIHYGKGVVVRLLTRLEYFQWRFTGYAFRDYPFIRRIIELKLKLLNKNNE